MCANLSDMAGDQLQAAVGRDGAVVLVRGEDLVLRDAAVRDLIRAAANGEDLSLGLDDFSAVELDLAVAVDAALTPPMFTTRRVVVVRDVGRFSTDQAEPLLGYLAAPNPTTCLILVAGGGVMARKLGEAIKRIGTVIESGAPTGKARIGWLNERLATAPVTLDGQAITRLAEHLGDDMGRLDGILAVLGAVHGEGSRIGVEQLEPFLGAAGSAAPWDLTDAIDRGDAAAALSQLGRQLGAGERHPLQVMGSLTSHFGRILRLEGADIRDENDAAKALGITGSTFPAKKALTQCRKLGHQNVVRAITLLAEADLDLRGRRDLPGDVVMEVLVARLARLAGPPTRPPNNR